MICILGIAIGFYGYLFPGNIILMILELYRKKRIKLLLFCIALIVVFESLYCSISLLFLNSINSESQVFKALELSSFILLLVMGIWMFFEKRKEENAIHHNTILRGIISIVFHPQQIPFWIIMGAVIAKFVPLFYTNQNLLSFVFFNAVGTFFSLLFYMISSKTIMQFFKLNGQQLKRIMGLVYITIALYNFISQS